MLCVTVTAPTTAELRRKRDEVTGADMVELRLDTVSDPDVAGALEGRRLPAIVTCRPEWEGGHFRGSEEERRAILREALALGAEYVDVEWRANFDDVIASTAGRRVVLSNHDFDGVPSDLAARAAAMRATGAEIIKLAGQDGAPQRLPAAPRTRAGRAGGQARGPGADRDGRVRPGDARAARRSSDRAGRTPGSNGTSDR